MEKHQHYSFKLEFDEFDSKKHLSQLFEIELTELQSDCASANIYFIKDGLNTNRMGQLAILYFVEFLTCEIARSCGEKPDVVYNTIHFFAPTICGDTLKVNIKEFRRLDGLRSFEFDVRDKTEQLLAIGSYDLMLKENISS